MKKLLYIVIVIMLVFVVYGCAFQSDTLRFKKEYESYNTKIDSYSKLKYLKVKIDTEDVKIDYATAEELVDLIKKGTGVIYFGYPECPWCRNAVPVLLDAAEEVGLSKIYYMNMKEERDVLKVDKNGNIVAEDAGTLGYKKLLKVLDSILSDYIIKDENGNEVNTNEKRIYVPLVIFVKDGKIIGVHTDTVDSQTNPYIKLNDEEEDELEKIYTDLMYKTTSKVCDENC